MRLVVFVFGLLLVVGVVLVVFVIVFDLVVEDMLLVNIICCVYDDFDVMLVELVCCWFIYVGFGQFCEVVWLLVCGCVLLVVGQVEVVDVVVV